MDRHMHRSSRCLCHWQHLQSKRTILIRGHTYNFYASIRLTDGAAGIMFLGCLCMLACIHACVHTCIRVEAFSDLKCFQTFSAFSFSAFNMFSDMLYDMAWLGLCHGAFSLAVHVQRHLSQNVHAYSQTRVSGDMLLVWTVPLASTCCAVCWPTCHTTCVTSLKPLLWLHFLIRELLKILVEMHLKVKLPSLVQHFLWKSTKLRLFHSITISPEIFIWLLQRIYIFFSQSCKI